MVTEVESYFLAMGTAAVMSFFSWWWGYTMGKAAGIRLWMERQVEYETKMSSRWDAFTAQVAKTYKEMGKDE